MARRHETRWDEDNRLRLNPWAFLTVALILGAIVGPVVGFSVFD